MPEARAKATPGVLPSTLPAPDRPSPQCDAPSFLAASVPYQPAMSPAAERAACSWRAWQQCVRRSCGVRRSHWPAPDHWHRPSVARLFCRRNQNRFLLIPMAGCSRQRFSPECLPPLADLPASAPFRSPDRCRVGSRTAPRAPRVMANQQPRSLLIHCGYHRLESPFPLSSPVHASDRATEPNTARLCLFLFCWAASQPASSFQGHLQRLLDGRRSA